MSDSPLFFAHIRASTGTAVQQTDAIRSATSLMMATGRSPSTWSAGSLLAVDPDLFADIEGQTTRADVLFGAHVRSGRGPAGRRRADGGLGGRIGHEHGVEFPLPMNGGRRRRTGRCGLLLLRPGDVPLAVFDGAGRQHWLGRRRPGAPAGTFLDGDPPRVVSQGPWAICRRPLERGPPIAPTASSGLERTSCVPSPRDRVSARGEGACRTAAVDDVRAAHEARHHRRPGRGRGFDWSAAMAGLGSARRCGPRTGS